MPIRFSALVFFCALAAAQAQNPQPTPSIVYSIHDPAAISQYRTNPALVRRMVDRLVVAVTGQADVASAWRSLVSPDDKVGIKICAAGGELFTTHVDIVNAIVDGLAAAGVPREHIIVWDRQLKDIKQAGYRASGYRLMAIEPRDGYDPSAVVTAPLLGKLIWGDLNYIPHLGANPVAPEKENTSSESHIAKILTQQVTKVINVPTMSDSAAAGLGGCIYNMTLPNIDNWRRYSQYGLTSAGGIAQLYAEPVIGRKVVFNIMDALIAAYAGGPESHPNYARHEARLLASKDPVAIDALALAKLQQLRQAASLPPIGELAEHVGIAAQLGLGRADREHVIVKELGR
ncbi:MAG: DUF362 domain-containing protein [Verrucomicrobiota bacterium]|nr:DUF362 domain-containing protein [Verrucomicrobiota bacterium]